MTLHTDNLSLSGGRGPDTAFLGEGNHREDPCQNTIPLHPDERVQFAFCGKTTRSVPDLVKPQEFVGVQNHLLGGLVQCTSL